AACNKKSTFLSNIYSQRKWKITRIPADKKKLNKATKDLKYILEHLKNLNFQEYVENLSPTEATDYSLWKATRKMNQPQTSIPPIKLADGNWARDAKEKANAFANHLQTVFKPFPSVIPDEEEATINNFLDAPFQMDLPIKNFKYTKVKTILQHNLNPKKSPGYDLITGKVLMELP